MSEYFPLLLSTPQLLEQYWSLAEPHFQRSVTEATNGEFGMDDLRAMAASGKLLVFVITDGERVELALAAELLKYPRLPVLNIVALGGKSTKTNYKKFWKHFVGWAYMSGVASIQGLVSPAMQRFTRSMGFKPVYTVVRYDLTGASDDPN